jgi:hypothetical protein
LNEATTPAVRNRRKSLLDFSLEAELPLQAPAQPEPPLLNKNRPDGPDSSSPNELVDTSSHGGISSHSAQRKVALALLTMVKNKSMQKYFLHKGE